MKPEYTYLDDIRYGKSTFSATTEDIASSVNQGLMNFYDALLMSKKVADHFREQNFFASPRRAALMLRRMIAEINHNVPAAEGMPQTAQRIPNSLLDPESFTFEEVVHLLGQIMDPAAPDMPMGRVVVTTFDMPFAGNFRLGLHLGRQFDAPTFITKAQMASYKIRELEISQN